MNLLKDPLIETRADGLVAVLTFQTGETSPLTEKFIDELRALVAASTKKQPLMHVSDRSVSAVYRAAVDFGQFTDERGLVMSYSRSRFADSRGDGQSARIKVDATCGTVELPDGGTWIGDRTPENTPRHLLAIFDPDAAAQAVAVLVDRWIEAEDIVEITQPVRVVKQRDTGQDEVNFWTHPNSWDPSDPRRLGGDHRGKVLRLRREAGIPDSETRDFDSLQELRAHSRALTAAAPREGHESARVNRAARGPVVC